MALKGQLTTTGYIPWDTFQLLLQKLERDGNYKFQLLFAVGTYVGLRISDLLRLRWKDVLDKDVLEIIEGKTKKVRRIHLNPELIAIMNRLYKKIGISDENELLYANKTKQKAMNIQYVNRQLKEISKRYNLPTTRNSISSHTFRKTMGRHIWEMNGYSEKSLLLLSEIFNHSSIKITKLYLGIREQELGDIYLNL
jgi:integrase